MVTTAVAHQIEAVLTYISGGIDVVTILILIAGIYSATSQIKCLPKFPWGIRQEPKSLIFVSQLLQLLCSACLSFIVGSNALAQKQAGEVNEEDQLNCLNWWRVSSFFYISSAASTYLFLVAKCGSTTDNFTLFMSPFHKKLAIFMKYNCYLGMPCAIVMVLVTTRAGFVPGVEDPDHMYLELHRIFWGFFVIFGALDCMMNVGFSALFYIPLHRIIRSNAARNNGVQHTSEVQAVALRNFVTTVITCSGVMSAMGLLIYSNLAFTPTLAAQNMIYTVSSLKLNSASIIISTKKAWFWTHSAGNSDQMMSENNNTTKTVTTQTA
jgi:hypothetical protein